MGHQRRQPTISPWGPQPKSYRLLQPQAKILRSFRGPGMERGLQNYPWTPSQSTKLMASVNACGLKSVRPRSAESVLALLQYDFLQTKHLKLNDRMRRRREKYLIHNTISLNLHHFPLYTIVRLLNTALVKPYHELKNIIPSSERLASIQAHSFLQGWIPCVIYSRNSQTPSPPTHLIQPSEHPSAREFAIQALSHLLWSSHQRVHSVTYIRPTTPSCRNNLS
jgi:hypothetical protein